MYIFLELAASFALLWFVPEGVFAVIKNYASKRDVKTLEYAKLALRSVLFGLLVASVSVFLFGSQPEQIVQGGVRWTVDSMLRWAGVDEVSLCMSRYKSQYRYTPEQFVEKASRSAGLLFGVRTFSDEQAILSEGFNIVTFENPSSLDFVMDESYRRFCENK